MSVLEKLVVFSETEFKSYPQTAEALNEHIRQIENETKVVEIMKSFPSDELVSQFQLSVF